MVKFSISRNLDGEDEIKQQLSSVSTSFCLAKWLQVSIHLPAGLTQSCYHPPTHKIPLSELENNPRALHNTVHKVLERKKMWEGKRPAGCSYCWKIEDQGHLSDRHYRSGEGWAQSGFDKVLEGSWDENINPHYVEVNFNQSCNFKCTYCSPHLSTEWEKEINKFGPVNIGYNKHNDIDALVDKGLMPIKGAAKENPYVEAFWKWWPDLYSDLKVFRMTGGEPLMDKNTFKVLDYVNKNPNQLLELSITSNMCPPQPKLFDQFITNIKNIENDITQEVYNEWIDRGILKEVTYFAESDPDINWQNWQRAIVLDDSAVDDPTIDPKKQRLTLEDIGLEFDSRNRTEHGDFLYTLIWFKPNENLEWKCLGAPPSDDEGNQGVMLNVPRIKNFMLFASIDSVGKQAEYIRNGLDWQVFQDNIHKFLRNTKNSEITFINTFNFLSITGFKHFLEYILELKMKFSESKDLCRIWFDIPLLREPIWMNADFAVFYPDMLDILDDCVKFMEQNRETEQGLGFTQFEIAKVKRNISIIKNSKIKLGDAKNRKFQFYNYFKQLDSRRNTSFVKTFPELSAVWKDCEKIKY